MTAVNGLLVDGYIRCIISLIDNNMIPKEINLLCLRFYYAEKHIIFLLKAFNPKSKIKDYGLYISDIANIK